VSPPIVLGIDPDVRTVGWSLCTQSKLLEVGVIRSDAAADVSHIQMMRAAAVALELILKQNQGLSLVVVESQAIRHGSAAVPKDILKLGQVAGGLAALCVAFHPGLKVAMPFPSDWKGQTPKPIHQARIFSHLGIGCAQATEYSYPTGCKVIAAVRGAQALLKSDWKHVADGVGLALWGAKLLQSGAHRATGSSMGT
jgi:hypothetical protein